MATKDKIMIFVDYENIRMGLNKKYNMDADPSQIAKLLKNSAEEHGRILSGRVYGDWSIPHMAKGKKVHTAREFEKQGFTPVMVSTKASGQDRSDSRLIIDCFEALMKQDNITAFMIVSGDGDFAYLARKIKEEGRRIIICGFSKSTNPELLGIASAFIAIESLLNLDVVEDIQKPTYNWQLLIEKLHIAQETLPFVAFKLFRDKWLIPLMGPINTQDERHRLLNEAKDEGIIQVSQQKNPNSAYPTSAINLNQEHPLVKKLLQTK